MAKNAVLALFLCSKKPQTLVYFCPFYAAVRNEGKVRAEGFEQAKCLLEKIASFCGNLLLISTRCAIMGQTDLRTRNGKEKTRFLYE